MKFTPLSIPDVILIEPRVHGDARGFFMETWHAEHFAEAGIAATFVQDNHSLSKRHTLRGLHYQIRHPQGKLVRTVSGEIFDVAVDLRRDSSTFSQWTGAYLSAQNKCQMWVPPGFAHGFLVLSEQAEFVYKCTDFYAPRHERALLWNDPELNVSWPLPAGTRPIISEKDAAGLPLARAEVYACAS